MEEWRGLGNGIYDNGGVHGEVVAGDCARSALADSDASGGGGDVTRAAHSKAPNHDAPPPLVSSTVAPSSTEPVISTGKSEKVLRHVSQFVRSSLFALDVDWAAALAKGAGSSVIGCRRGDPLRRQVFLSPTGASLVFLLNMPLRRGTTRWEMIVHRDCCGSFEFGVVEHPSVKVKYSTLQTMWTVLAVGEHSVSRGANALHEALPNPAVPCKLRTREKGMLIVSYFFSCQSQTTLVWHLAIVHCLHCHPTP